MRRTNSQDELLLMQVFGFSGKMCRLLRPFSHGTGHDFDNPANRSQVRTGHKSFGNKKLVDGSFSRRSKLAHTSNHLSVSNSSDARAEV